MFAAASLKLGALDRELRLQAHFPRHVCRGLIEARRIASMSSRSADFPRHVCRGLIEAIQQTGANPLGATFRGMFAAASLKLRRHGADRHRDGRLSAACLPRPH